MQIRHFLAAGALLVLGALHVDASPTSDVAVVDPRSLFTTLHPGIHPDDDTADLDNLKGKFNSSLYYKAKPDALVQGAGVMQLKHKYPTVSLERSRFVSVTCQPASDTMVVSFDHSKAFNTAVTDWSTHKSGFILISYVAGCGEGTDSSERSFHFVHNFDVSEKDLRITCHIITIPIHHTVDENETIKLHVATYRLEDPAGPHPRNASQTTASVPEPSSRAISPRAVVSAPLSKRGWFSNIFAAIKKAVVYVAKTIVRTIIGVATLPLSYRPSLSARFGTQNVKPYNSMYRDKPAYLLYHSESGSRSFDLTCPQCGAEFAIFFAGTFEGTFVGGFTQANMGLDMDLSITLALGVHANYKVEGNKDFFTINAFVPGANIVIPAILEVGPAVGLTVGAGYSVELDGFFSAGFTCSWKKVGGRVDFLKSSNSVQTGQWALGTVCTRILDAEVSASVAVSVYVKLAIKLRVSVLPKLTTKLTGEAALVEKLSLILRTAVSTTAGTCKPLVPYLTGSVQSELYIAITNVPDIPLHEPYNYQIFGVCIGPKAANTIDAGNPSVATIGESEKATSAFDLGDPSALVDFNDLVLDWTSTGITVARVMDPAYKYDTWREMNDTIFASSDGRTLFAYPSVILADRNVVGRLTIDNPDAVPATRNELFVGQAPDSVYAIFVDDILNLNFYTIVCSFTDNRREVFLTTLSDPITGAASVKNQPTITGAGVTACTATYFHIYD